MKIEAEILIFNPETFLAVGRLIISDNKTGDPISSFPSIASR
jgi:hypothetical protein